MIAAQGAERSENINLVIEGMLKLARRRPIHEVQQLVHGESGGAGGRRGGRGARRGRVARTAADGTVAVNQPKHIDIERVAFGSSSHRGGWIVSYADMMTIILTFFILLLSISTIAQTKYELMVQAFTGDRAGNLTEVKEQIDEVIEEQQLGGEISTQLDKDGLAIEFSNALLFNSGQAQLKEGAESIFGPIERHLVEDLEPRYGLVIEGYTDDVPISNAEFSSNWELSSSRAIHVMERLHQAGMDPQRVSIKGYADTRPATEVDLTDPAQVAELSESELEEARAANRRVIIRVDALSPELLERLGPSGSSPTAPRSDTAQGPAGRGSGALRAARQREQPTTSGGRAGAAPGSDPSEQELKR